MFWETKKLWAEQIKDIKDILGSAKSSDLNSQPPEPQSRHLSCSCRRCSGSMTCNNLTSCFSTKNSCWIWDTFSHSQAFNKVRAMVGYRRKAENQEETYSGWYMDVPTEVIWAQEQRPWSCVKEEPETLLTYKNQAQFFSAILYRAKRTIWDAARIPQTTHNWHVTKKPGAGEGRVVQETSKQISWQWNQSQRMEKNKSTV